VFAVHYRPRKISELSPKDSKIAIVGNITQRKDSSFVLDDGTARIEVFFDNDTVNVLDIKLARAFCSVMEDKLHADIVQKLDGMDLDLFKKTEDLYSRYYV
jgi:hypothetical protein